MVFATPPKPLKTIIFNTLKNAETLENTDKNGIFKKGLSNEIVVVDCDLSVGDDTS